MASCILKENDIETPVKEAGVLLAFILNREVPYLYAHPEERLSPGQADRFIEAVRKRSQHMPFQYISNRQEFMSLDFYVDPGCLIPRPDTEILVEAALDWMNAHRLMPMRLLDIGTGSGAIAVSCAHFYENAQVDALDFSKEALSIAERNARTHRVQERIRFIHANFLAWKAENPYTVVLSNPPYIPRDEIRDLMPGVRDYEPSMALDGGEDGLLFYRAIADRVAELLLPGGAVFTEVGIGQAEPVARLFREKGLKTCIYKDLAGIDRVVSGELDGKNS